MAKARRVSAALLALVSLVILKPAAADSACPSPRTCPDFVLNGPRWQPSADGSVTIGYWVNPANPWIPEGQVLAAISEAARAWELALPSVHFEFYGTTDEPVVPTIGLNEIGWGVPPAAAATTITYAPGNGEWITSAQTIFAVAPPEFAYGCEQTDGSCVDAHQDTERDWAATSPLGVSGQSEGCLPQALDLQSTMTLEFGHWLGLGDLTGSSDRELSMSSDSTADTPCGVMRWKSTLGLGDILGARTLYPCDCTLPYIYEP